MISFFYDTEYFPAIPAFEVFLGKPGSLANVGPFKAIVDTGADTTIIPIADLIRCNAQKVEQAAILRSQWGERRAVSLYSAAIGIGPCQFLAVQVVGDERGNEFVIGRNVLNRLRLVLDGPAGLTEVLEKI